MWLFLGRPGPAFRPHPADLGGPGGVRAEIMNIYIYIYIYIYLLLEGSHENVGTLLRNIRHEGNLKAPPRRSATVPFLGAEGGTGGSLLGT